MAAHPPDSLGPGRAKYLCGGNAALKDSSPDRVFAAFRKLMGQRYFLKEIINPSKSKRQFKRVGSPLASLTDYTKVEPGLEK